MGVYLGQLPAAELARLKAELAETLIAYFCYPRFFDYRTASLRTRPVDRAKRQEVWLYLSSVDFTAWNRIDLMSSDFQHQIERLFIHFVQRNRCFFGEQGRKRMADIRMLIGTSAASVVQGLRGHLTGSAVSNPPFGSPRPVSSWSTTNILGRPEKSWEHIAPATMLLQQQLQELRGEIKPAAAQSVMQPTTTNVQRPNRPQLEAANQANGIEHQPTAVSHVPVNKTPVHTNGHIVSGATAVPDNTSTSSLSEHKSTSPLHPGSNANSASPTPTVEPVEPSLSPTASIASYSKLPRETGTLSEKKHVHAPPASAVQSHVLAQSPSVIAASTHDNASLAVGEEDMAVFEQLRHQLMIWLRVEAIRSGINITNQGPLQLLELLRQHAPLDESRLQIVSSLLNLSNQVLKNGQANLFDYKQALMFHLMHTRH
ncbi:MAG: hypothetical protein NVSMB33_08860 [Ktedonobacteraceae bacterium]